MRTEIGSTPTFTDAFPDLGDGVPDAVADTIKAAVADALARALAATNAGERKSVEPDGLLTRKADAKTLGISLRHLAALPIPRTRLGRAIRYLRQDCTSSMTARAMLADRSGSSSASPR